MFKLSKAGRLFAFAFFLLTFACPSLAFNVVNGNSEGTGSLAWAIQQANQGGDNAIIISPSVKLITLNSEITIQANMTIIGNGATLRGESLRRLFRVTSGHVTFNRLTFTGGNAFSGNGGAVEVDGEKASAEFNNCTFFGNTASNYGGAVCVTRGDVNLNTLLKHCTIAGNTASNGGGVALIDGGMSLFSSVIVGNTGNNDIYATSSRYFRSHYNVAGTSNFTMDETDLDGQTLSNVLVTEDSGAPKAEEVDNTRIIRLAQISPAINFVPYEANYVLSVDEVGRTRPQLSKYDAGAYEAIPVAVTSAEIYGSSYVQIDRTAIFSIDIQPKTALLNVNDYPPYGVEWFTDSPSVLEIDNYGRAKAVGLGSVTVMARVHGWNSDGTPIRLMAKELEVSVGSEVLSDMQAVISSIGNKTIYPGNRETFRPEVKIIVGDYELSDIKGGVNYTLGVSSSNPDIVAAEVVSGDSIRLIARNTEGTSDITVTAAPYPAGQSMRRDFTVTVSTSSSSGGGRSVGGSGGGCESFGAFFAGICAVAFSVIRRKINAE